MLYFPVPQILQNPELPNGCEITSLCMLLRYWGYDADKCVLADRYLPRTETWWGTDPDLAYMGNPHLEDDSPACGYYCFAGPIVAAATAYLADQEGSRILQVPGKRNSSPACSRAARSFSGRLCTLMTSVLTPAGHTRSPAAGNTGSSTSCTVWSAAEWMRSSSIFPIRSISTPACRVRSL